MIPEFDDNGNLPVGVHFCHWSEFKERFGYTRKRRQMIQGLEEVMAQLKAAGCRNFYINGSFVTREPSPNDFDCCWDQDDVDIDYLRKNAPLILNFYNSNAQKAKYRGEIYPSDQPVDEDTVSIEFFQLDRRQNKKGIIGINLQEWEL
ncbi:DUF6932 family protein [Iningainema tapete]|uniref:Uncharacterized protein n=1 Tax=Iningainema tapete BLCC-T55 TaxID=2748662 RepID=A0A8J6XI49_9CYAN|nr:hypothetical protein [Iningainema tapete]MBD2772751.1 hypothetical protein [Iningainema tapete BLCC-T55]